MPSPPSRPVMVAIACEEGDWPHPDWPQEDPSGGTDMICRAFFLPPPYQPLRTRLRDVVDVVVLHCQKPMAELPRLLRALGGRSVPVLIISPDRSAEQVVTAFRHGVTSYMVDGDYTGCALTGAVVGTAMGHTSLSPAASVSLLDGAMRLGSSDEDVKPLRAALSPREQEIMERLAGGFGASEIGKQLGLSEKTVRNNLSRIYVKLRARSSTDAVRLWLGHRPRTEARGEEVRSV